jgi:hypothetical protein
MMVACPKFDYSSWQYAARLAKIISDMGALTKDKSVAPRLRFIIRDVLDARDAGWPQSRNGGKAPAKLEELRNAVCTSPVQQPATKEQVPPWRMRKDSVEDTAAANQKDSPKKQVKFCFNEDAEVFVPQAQAPVVPQETFNVVSFRRTLASIFSDLASDKNIPGAVQRVRLEKVPVAHQADQFVDILTRIVEERRGAVRRCELAFITALAAADHSAFDREACLAGIGLFFKGVYGELCEEVHRLPAIMKSEFLPTLLTVFDAAELNKVFPPSMRKQ